MGSPKDEFLERYEAEHATTMRVLRAYPADRLDLQPHPKSKTARELAWIFVMERGLGTHLWNDAFKDGFQGGTPPESWDEILGALETAHREFADLVRGTPDEKLYDTVRFFVAPKTLGDQRRIDVAWMLLNDQIHHRGQFSVYLRMADGKVPSIYGPSADEPWI